jgi:heat shock protein HslJ
MMTGDHVADVAEGSSTMTISFAGPLRGCAAGTLAALALAGCGSSASLAQPAAALEGTPWTLVALRGASVAGMPHAPSLLLQADQKRASGSSGCNRYTGGYTLAGEHLSFGPAAGTRMACMQGMEQEQAFLDALSAVAAWRIEGQRLELRDANGQAVLQFTKAGS